MFASFHAKGTIPSCSEMLNTCASGVHICTELNAALRSCYTSPFQIHILPVLFVIQHYINFFIMTFEEC